MSEVLQDVSVSVGKRGEIVIPASIRRQSGLGYGSNLVMSWDGESFRLTPKNFGGFRSKWQAKSNSSSKKAKGDNSIDPADKKREKFLENILKK